MSENFEGNLKPEQPEITPVDGGRTSSVARVVGEGSERETEELARLGEMFIDQSLLKFESEKTQEELEVIDGILTFFPEFVEKYGGKTLPVTADHIHIIDFDSLDEEQKKRYMVLRDAKPIDRLAGFIDPKQQKVVAFASKDKLWQAEVYVHELMHLQAYASLNASDNNVRYRRSGFRIYNKKGEAAYFSSLDESIIDGLTKRFIKQYFDAIPPLHTLLQQKQQRQQERRKQLSKLMDIPIEALMPGTVPYEIGDGAIPESKAWQQEFIIAALKESMLPPFDMPHIYLFNRIYEENKDRFSSPEEVFELFARSVFSGKLLEAAKLIEKTFGKGAFRDEGEYTMESTNIVPKLEFEDDTHGK